METETVVKLESMKIAAELLCCLMKSGHPLPPGSVPNNDYTAEGEQTLFALFFALSNRIYAEVQPEG